jgi:hypothetical protein
VGRRRVTAAALAVALAVVTAATLAEPAYAGCQAGPDHGDGRIRRGSQPYLGAGIQNCNGVGQTVASITGPAEKKAFRVRYENDCKETFDVRLFGQIEGETADFKVKAFRPEKGNKKVTEKFFGSGVLYRAIPVGKSTPPLRIVIKGRETVEIGDDVTVTVQGQLDDEGLDNADVVKAVAGLPV